jgi:hypothetical protein
MPGGWSLVQPPRAARIGFPSEMLDRVGHVQATGIEAGLGEGSTQQRAGGSDEGLAIDVLGVTGLFADENYARLHGPRTEHDLSGPFV